MRSQYFKKCGKQLLRSFSVIIFAPDLFVFAIQSDAYLHTSSSFYLNAIGF